MSFFEKRNNLDELVYITTKDEGEFENGFCVSLLNRSIQDLSDHGASKERDAP